ncbi:MAG: cytochrome c [Gemmatimonadaceae bacterium]
MKTDTSAMLHRAAKLLTAAVLPLAFGACSWFTDFKRQPAIEPWEPMSQSDADSTTVPRGAPAHSVPIGGVPTLAYAISYQRLPATIDSFSTIANPVAVDERSISNGRLQYQINCSTCHGFAGDGKGTLQKYGFAATLVAATAPGRSDGYIWGMIRNGRGAMPSYNRVEQMDRWDIVNYVRALQGKSALKADTTRAGYAGQNGTTVPRASATAPTLPMPFRKPDITPTPGSKGVNSATYPAVGKAESKEKPE